MTEAEWLSYENPTPMLEFLRGKMSDRKLRLFACACCRQLIPLVGTEDYVQGIERAEAYADQRGTKSALKRSRQALHARSYPLHMDSSFRGGPDEWKARHSNECNALSLGVAAMSEKDFRSFPTYLSDVQSEQGGDLVKEIVSRAYMLIRDIFPFRPIPLLAHFYCPISRTADVRHP
jgi:hypothetical protein